MLPQGFSQIPSDLSRGLLANAVLGGALVSQCTSRYAGSEVFVQVGSSWRSDFSSAVSGHLFE